MFRVLRPIQLLLPGGRGRFKSSRMERRGSGWSYSSSHFLVLIRFPKQNHQTAIPAAMKTTIAVARPATKPTKKDKDDGGYA